MSERFRIGVKPGYGPVIKAMVSAADHPWTTPNTDWDKFVINSEVQEIAYGSTGISHTFTPSAYEWGSSSVNPVLNWWPNEASWIWHARTIHSGNGAYLDVMVNPANVPGANLNAFHFVIRDASDFVPYWKRVERPYSASWYYVTYKYFGFGRSLGWDAVAYDTSTGTWSVNTFAPGGIGLWPSGVVGGSNEETSGPNSRNYYTDRTFKFTYYRLDLPIDASPYPAVVGTPAPGRKIFRLSFSSPFEFKMAKPGFDLDTATPDQLLFSEDKVPLKVIRTGMVTVTAGTTATINLGANYSPTSLVDYQCNVVGEDLYIPPMRGTQLAAMDVEYRISGTNLQFRNPTTLNFEVRYFVMAQDDLEPSTGTAKVFEVKPGGFVLRRRNTGGSRLADVILDTDMPVMPIIKQGWIPFSEMVATDSTYMGSHMATVSFDAKSYKPYVLARLCRRHKTRTNERIFLNFYAKKPNTYNYLADSSFAARVSSNQVRFYCGDGVTKYEDVWLTSTFPQVPQQSYGEYVTVGIRYYIFAVPPSL